MRLRDVVNSHVAIEHGSLIEADSLESQYDKHIASITMHCLMMEISLMLSKSKVPTFPCKGEWYDNLMKTIKENTEYVEYLRGVLAELDNKKKALHAN